MSEALTAKGQVWKAKIEQWQVSGQTIKTWCKEHNISYNIFQYWRARLGRVKPRDTSNNPPFVELPDGHSPCSGIELRIKEVSLHLSPTFDAVALAGCLRVLRGL